MRRTGVFEAKMERPGGRQPSGPNSNTTMKGKPMILTKSRKINVLSEKIESIHGLKPGSYTRQINQLVELGHLSRHDAVKILKRGLRTIAAERRWCRRV